MDNLVLLQIVAWRTEELLNLKCLCIFVYVLISVVILGNHEEIFVVPFEEIDWD